MLLNLVTWPILDIVYIYIKRLSCFNIYIKGEGEIVKAKTEAGTDKYHSDVYATPVTTHRVNLNDLLQKAKAQRMSDKITNLKVYSVVILLVVVVVLILSL